MGGNLNSGKRWSEIDLADLETALERGYPIDLIADFLKRDTDEVRQQRDALLAARPPTARRAPDI